MTLFDESDSSGTISTDSDFDVYQQQNTLSSIKKMQPTKPSIKQDSIDRHSKQASRNPSFDLLPKINTGINNQSVMEDRTSRQSVKGGTLIGTSLGEQRQSSQVTISNTSRGIDKSNDLPPLVKHKQTVK